MCQCNQTSYRQKTAMTLWNLKQKKVMKATKVKQNFGPIHLKNRDHGEIQSFASKGKKTLIPKVATMTNSCESKVKDSPNRGITVSIGDSQLHRIEETQLSNRYVKTLVRSKGVYYDSK